jgi:lipopolysaccharide heptosyltransferase II
MQHWHHCKKILCIRPDNMGDLLMTTPALRALKESLGAHITMLTSSMAAGIAKYITEIDEVITFDVPWVKTTHASDEASVFALVEQLKIQQFDTAVIFTVYSQNPMPTIMLAYLAGIPLRLAYCRENPYHLLTHWIPDPEPYTLIKHQVRRDLDLVASIGATTTREELSLDIPEDGWAQVQNKLQQRGINLQQPWLVMHPGVSEPKREYPAYLWAEAAQKVAEQLGYQVLLTGSGAESALTENIYHLASHKESIYPVAGMFSLEEFIVLIKQAPVLVSVNTGTIHIAAATGTPTVVLYALTNPQHTPWKVACQVLPFAVPPEAQSRNEVIRHVNRYLYDDVVEMPCADEIVTAVQHLLTERATQTTGFINEINITGHKIPV